MENLLTRSMPMLYLVIGFQRRHIDQYEIVELKEGIN